jgi:ribosome-binding factor A
MGSQVRMKRTPLLAFELDPAVVAGDRVEDVLRRLHDLEQRRSTSTDEDQPDR